MSHRNILKYSAISQYQVRLTSWRKQAMRGRKIQKQEKIGRLWLTLWGQIICNTVKRKNCFMYAHSLTGKNDSFRNYLISCHIKNVFYQNLNQVILYKVGTKKNKNMILVVTNKYKNITKVFSHSGFRLIILLYQK